MKNNSCLIQWIFHFEILTWFILMQEFTSSDDDENHQTMGFKDFTLRQHYRFNRFSQSAGRNVSHVCWFVLLFLGFLTTQPIVSSWLMAPNGTKQLLLSDDKERRNSSSSRILDLFPPLIMWGNINSWWIHRLPSWPQQGAHVTHRLFTHSARQDSQAHSKSA